jgi:hypothetical protein
MKPKKSDFMDISRSVTRQSTVVLELNILNVFSLISSGFSAEQIAKWINDRTDVQVNIVDRL